MLDPNLVLDFQQKFKQLQIHAGMGLTEENIDKIDSIIEQLGHITENLYYQVYPSEVIEEVPIKSK